jgi:hypothetical protein
VSVCKSFCPSDQESVNDLVTFVLIVLFNMVMLDAGVLLLIWGQGD